MGIAFDTTRTLYDNADADTFAIGPWTPTVGNRLIAIFATFGDDATLDSVSDDFIGGGLTWSAIIGPILKTVAGSADIEVYAYSAVVTGSPGSGTVTFDFTSGNQPTGFIGYVFEVSAQNGIADSGSDSGTDAAAAAVLAATSGNGVVAALFNHNNSISATWISPMALEDENAITAPTVAASSATSTSEDVSVDVSWTGSTDHVLIAVEIIAAGAAGAAGPLAGSGGLAGNARGRLAA